MMVDRYRKWRPLVGVLAVGMLAFGLSLQGAPAGDDTAPSADRVKRVTGNTDAVSKFRSDVTVSPPGEREIVLPTTDAEALTKYIPGALKVRRPVSTVQMRIKSVTDYAPVPAPAGREAVAVGDPCSCDADCAGLTTEGGCQLGQCMRAADTGVDNIDGTCQIMVQVADVRCETDGDPCTAGRCQGDGTCKDDGTMECPCAKECTGEGDDAGQNCGLHNHCATPNVCSCKTHNGMTVSCVNDAGKANCQINGSDTVFGRCCDPAGVVAGSYTTKADCDALSYHWMELTDPDDEMHDPVRCPVYSSGIVFGNTSDDGDVIYPIVPPPRQCSRHAPEDNFGALCEVDEDCHHRCSGDDLTICQTNADCSEAGGTCIPDQCVSALDVDVTDPADGGRCPGYYMIGDDYVMDVPAGKALRLQEIRFRGGAAYSKEVLYFDFYDNESWRCVRGANHGNSCTPWSTNECDEPNGACRPVRTGSYGLRMDKPGIFTYTIERDCDPDCDEFQWCDPPTRQCECLADNQTPGGCIADPPMIIPRNGFMVMRAGRALTSVWGIADDLNGSWVPVDGPYARAGVEVGGNDPNVMWVDDGPINAAGGPLGLGARVLAFELVGRIIDDPEGACCDEATGICVDVNEWDCRFCAGPGTEGTVRKVCDRGRAWANVDADCPDPQDWCLTADWSGPRTRDEFDNPTCHGGANDGDACVDSVVDCLAPDICYGGQRCGTPDYPCSGGACCSDDGSCYDGGICRAPDANVGTRCDLEACAADEVSCECDVSINCEPQVPTDCPLKRCRKNITQTCVDDSGCIDTGPCVADWRGYGSTCEPNCCPQPFDAFGECCMDKYQCTGGLHMECDPDDPGSWPEDCDTCELACYGPYIFDIPVPSLIPPGQYNVVDITSDSTASVPNTADSCAHGSDDGWFTSFHVNASADVTYTFCCSQPLVGLVQQVLTEGCPCDGPTTLINPNPGRSGYGDACGNNFCCTDGNYSVNWTVRAGTYHYGQNAGSNCEQSSDDCGSDEDCMPGEICKSWKMPFQGHLYVEPTYPAACCTEDVCTYVSEHDCEDGGGDWLGDLLNPVADCTCFGDPPVCPCDDGACCLPDGTCEDQNGDKISPEDCAALDGAYHGGVKCTNNPCAVCEFEDQAHCQLDTGQFIFPSDRFQGTRRADDFRPQDTPIRRVCFNFGFVTENPPPECADDPPRDDFNLHIYQDALGVPGTELPETVAGTLNVDRGQPYPALRTWLFSAPLEPPVDVVPGECYWLEITGMGDGNCQCLWTHSVDGNNYGVRDDNDSYGYEDVRDNDVVFCLDCGIIVATQPGINGGCGPIPAACCKRDGSCSQTTYYECSEMGGFPIPHATCSPTLCPSPDNDLCHIPEDPVNEDRPPTGASALCLGDPARPDLGEWIYWDGETGATRLGRCNAWPGIAGFGEVCHPMLQDCVDPATATCLPYTDGDAYECYADTDNRLAGTDGPYAGGDCFGSGETSFQADVWYKLTAPCSGEVRITMCAAPTYYDSMLGVFGDDTAEPRCPGTGDDNGDLIVCNDDYCTGSGTVSGLRFDALKEGVYILRMGGWSNDGGVLDASMGESQIHIGFFCIPEVEWLPPGLPPNDDHRTDKHRYISIDPTTNPTSVSALKVTIAEMRRCENDLTRSCMVSSDCRKACAGDLLAFCNNNDQCPGTEPCMETGPCIDIAPAYAGVEWFVQEPQRNSNCPMPGGPVCGDEDWFARLSTTNVYSSTWTDFGDSPPVQTLHVGDCPIVPCVTYYVQACNPVLTDECSLPLEIGTQVMPWEQPRNFGDVAGPVTPQLQFTKPDGFQGVVDTMAYLLTNANWGTVNLPQAHPTWVDLHGLGTGIPPQYILSVSDLGLIYVYAGTYGWPWQNTVGGLEPCNCPGVSGVIACPAP